MKSEIVLTFDDDGTYTVEAKGFVGQACRKATAEFEELLGPVTTRTATREALRKKETHVRTTTR